MNKLLLLFLLLSAAGLAFDMLMWACPSLLWPTPLTNSPFNSLHNVITTKSSRLKQTEASRHKKAQENRPGIHHKTTTRMESSLKGNLSSHAAVFKGDASAPVRLQKYVIYRCLPGQLCGGWSDRQRGLVGVYVLALVTGRRFGVHMLHPCNLTQFYLPSQVNWVIPAADLLNKTSVVVNDMGSRGGVLKLLTTGDFNHRYPQDVVYIQTNCPYYHEAIIRNKRYVRHLPQWVKSPRPAFFAKAWKILMRPSPFLQHRLDEYLQSIGYENRTRPLVGCHVRVGRSQTLKSDGPIRMNVSDVTILWKFVDKYVQNGSKLFLATDNLEVRGQSRARYGHNATDTGGSIVHVDRTRGAREKVCDGFGYALLDQLILTKSDVLVLSSSGFGRRAAYLRGGTKNLFQFVRKKVEVLSNP
ncbi:hypothetical protein ACOMHN_035734 [Nucella lapillus]